MDRTSRPGALSRPPPTSPKGHVKKKARREGPNRPQVHNESHDTNSPRSHGSPSLPHQSGRSSREGDERETKPHHLGGYVIQPSQPTAPEFKIRGRSVGQPPKAEDCDLDDVPSLTELQRVFLSSVSGGFEHIQEFEKFLVNSGVPPNHPTARILPRIKGQLNRLSEVYRAMNAEIDGLVNELDQFADREHELRRKLDDSESAIFKLRCANRELCGEARDVKSAADEAEVELHRLRRETKELKDSHEGAERRYRKLRDDHGDTWAEKLRLLETVRKRDTEIEKAAAQTSRLQDLVNERDKQVEVLQSDNLALQTLVRQREAEAEEAAADRLALQSVIREKEAEVSALMAVRPPPITPLTPLAELGPFAFPAALGILRPQPQQTQPPPQGSTSPFIKQEAPEQETLAETAVVLPQQSAPAEVSQDHAQQLYQLGAGAASILGKLFLVEPPVPYNDVLSTFLTNLGAAPDLPSINVNSTTEAADFWSFDDPWMPGCTAPPSLHPSLDAQFAHLSLLFPFTAMPNPTPIDISDPTAFHLISSLLTSLIKADHAASPRAGLAFLQTMASFIPPIITNTATDTISTPLTPRTALLNILLTELCHALESYFPDVPKLCDYHSGDLPLLWNGPTGLDRLPNIGRLAQALREGDRSADGVAGVREVLGAGCGDAFCWFKTGTVSSSSIGFVGGDGGGDASPPDDAGGNKQGTGSQRADGAGFNTSSATNAAEPEGAATGEKEIGLLHCGGENADFFLMTDFDRRKLRVVDCRLARMTPNAAEPSKFDFIIARGPAGDTQGRDGEEEELFRLAAAPKSVATFWVKVCYG